MRLVYSFVSLLLAYLFVGGGVVGAQILPDAGDARGKVYFEIGSRSVETEGKIQAISCGDKAKRFDKCHRFVSTALGKGDICLRGQPLFLLYDGQEVNPDSQYVLFGNYAGRQDRIISLKIPLPPKKGDDTPFTSGYGLVRYGISGITAEVHPCEDFVTKQTVEPIALLPTAKGVGFFEAASFYGAEYIDDCLLAERKLAFTAVSHSYKTMEFVCVVFPASYTEPISDIAIQYVNEMSQHSAIRASSRSLKLYYDGNSTGHMYLHNSTGKNVNTSCYDSLRVGSVSEVDVRDFYRSVNVVGEVPEGSSVVIFARNRSAGCLALE